MKLEDGQIAVKITHEADHEMPRAVLWTRDHAERSRILGVAGFESPLDFEDVRDSLTHFDWLANMLCGTERSDYYRETIFTLTFEIIAAKQILAAKRLRLMGSILTRFTNPEDTVEARLAKFSREFVEECYNQDITWTGQVAGKFVLGHGENVRAYQVEDLFPKGR